MHPLRSDVRSLFTRREMPLLRNVATGRVSCRPRGPYLFACVYSNPSAMKPKTLLKIDLEKCPDVLGHQAVKMNVNICGDRHELAVIFAALLAKNPAFVSVVIEALANLDNIHPVSSVPNN